MLSLPEEFLKRMSAMLGTEYPGFLEGYRRPAVRGCHLNTLKCTQEKLCRGLPFPVEPSPFSAAGYIFPQDAERVGRLPLHHAGAFYVQEPSASAPVTVLDPQPGERILDLCAAPGGKSAQIASALAGKGVLWSNEIVRSRASVLSSNLERLGVQNAVVSCCHPEKLCGSLVGYFDRVLVDAPCSGEGMFRRSEEAVQDWSPAHVAACAERQGLILNCAAGALRQNGILVYSTCTFSKEENEDVVTNFLASHEDFALENCGMSFGRPGLLPETRRIYPMDGGEGQFMARLRRLSAPEGTPAERGHRNPSREGEGFFRTIFRSEPRNSIERDRDILFLVPDFLPETKDLGVLRIGVPLGTLRGGRVEPAHGLFMAAEAGDFRREFSYPLDSPELAAFLRGEELVCPDETFSGYCAVLADGIPTGFGKCSGGRIKNHYPKGLRNLL